MTFSCRMQTITMEPAIRRRCMGETDQAVMEDMVPHLKMKALKMIAQEKIALQEFSLFLQ